MNYITQIVHMPTITKMTRDLRGPRATRLTLPNEALMFSIYYAAVTSMEEDDVGSLMHQLVVLRIFLAF